MNSQLTRFLSRDGAVILGVIAVASVLRLIQIDSQLWLDEISAISSSLRRPLFDIATEWPGVASHVFFELMAKMSVLIFGESSFAVRLPAAVMGIVGVAAFAYLGRLVLTRRAALVAAGLFALSYHHIFFSQNARGYTTLIAFSLLATILAIKILRAGRCSGATLSAYTAVLVLSAYSQPFGLFVPAGHALTVLALLVYRPAGIPPIPIRSFLVAGVFASVALALLYVPFLSGMLAHAEQNISSPAEGPRFGLGLVVEVIEGLSAALGGSIGLAFAMLIGLIGLVGFLRQQPVTLLLLAVPIVAQMAAFVAAGVGIHPRYFAIALPAAILIGAQGLATAAEYSCRLIFSSERIRQGAINGILVIIVVASAQPLIRYYQYPKQDFLSALTYIEEHAGENDSFLGIHSSGSVLGDFYDAPFLRVETLEELRQFEQTADRIWVVTTLERIISAAAPDLIDHVHTNYEQQARYPGTVGDGTVVVYLSRGSASAE